MAEKMMAFPFVQSVVEEGRRYRDSRMLGFRCAILDAALLGICLATIFHG